MEEPNVYLNLGKVEPFIPEPNLHRPFVRVRPRTIPADAEFGFVDEYGDRHYWIGDARKGDTMETGVVCFKADPSLVERAQASGNTWVNITLDKSQVTCQQCLEWIHA